MTKRNMDVREGLARAIHESGDFEFAKDQVEHLREQLEARNGTFATAMQTIALMFCYVVTHSDRMMPEEIPEEIRMPMLLDVVGLLQQTFEAVTEH